MQTAALDAILDARLAVIAALEAHTEAMKAGEAAGLTEADLQEIGVPPLPGAAAPGETEKSARRQRAPRGSGPRASRGRNPRTPAVPTETPARGNGPVPAHIGAPHTTDE